MALPTDKIFAHTLYLKDHNGRTYAIVRGKLGCELANAHGAKMATINGTTWEPVQPTNVRHRKSLEEGIVASVETGTDLVRLEDDETRSKWRHVDEYDVIGASALPLTPDQVKAELLRLDARARELKEMNEPKAEKAKKAATV